MRVWNTGGELLTDMDWKAMPIRPSAGNWLLSKPEEYCVAAPSVWSLASVWHVSVKGWEKRWGVSAYRQACDVDDIGILLTADGRAIPETKGKGLPEILRSGTCVRDIRLVP